MPHRKGDFGNNNYFVAASLHESYGSVVLFSLALRSTPTVFILCLMCPVVETFAIVMFGSVMIIPFHTFLRKAQKATISRRSENNLLLYTQECRFSEFFRNYQPDVTYFHKDVFLKNRMFSVLIDCFHVQIRDTTKVNSLTEAS